MAQWSPNLILGLVGGAAVASLFWWMSRDGGSSSKAAPQATQTNSSAAEPPGVPTPEPRSSIEPPVPAPPDSMMSIPQRFERDAKNRPAKAVRAEQVIASLKEAGYTITKQAQHLSGPFLAQYCYGFSSSDQLDFSVCEYKDDATASKGRDEALRFGKEGREVTVLGNTTLTVRFPQGAEGERSKAKAVALFRELKPQPVPVVSATATATPGAAPVPRATAAH